MGGNREERMREIGRWLYENYPLVMPWSLAIIVLILGIVKFLKAINMI